GSGPTTPSRTTSPSSPRHASNRAVCAATAEGMPQPSGLPSSRRRLVLEPRLQPGARLLAQAADGAFGTAELLADLLRTVPLERQFQHGAVVGVEAAQQFLHQLGEHGALLRRWLTVHQRPVAASGQLHLAAGVAAMGLLVLDVPDALA